MLSLQPKTEAKPKKTPAKKSAAKKPASKKTPAMNAGAKKAAKPKTPKAKKTTATKKVIELLLHLRPIACHVSDIYLQTIGPSSRVAVAT